MKKVLIFRIGSLGDTLVSVPAMWQIRNHFAKDKITLLCDFHPKKNYVLAADLLNNSGIVDDFMLYPVDEGYFGRFIKPWNMLKLLLEIKSKKYNTLVYLAPTGRTTAQVIRDRNFFHLAGIREFIGINHVISTYSINAKSTAILPTEADFLISRISRDNLDITYPLRLDIGINDFDKEQFLSWQRQKCFDGKRTWIAVGPGSKMPAKIWPSERYLDVVQALIHEMDVWPIVFGDNSDRSIGDYFISRWGRGWNAAGDLSLRASIFGLGQCKLYLGNDTGTMHMAASASTPCVAIFSSRAVAGLWYPYGPNHTVFRTKIDCEGCGLQVCVERKMECLLKISSVEVLDKCIEVLRDQSKY